jgi:hypothetical protein
MSQAFSASETHFRPLRDLAAPPKTGQSFSINDGHAKIDSTVRYLGVDVEDALELAERTEV